MRANQINTQVSIFLFIDIVFSLLLLAPSFLQASQAPLTLFVCRVLIVFIKYECFMVLPETQTLFNKRLDLLASSRVQCLKQYFINLNFISLITSLKNKIDFQEFVLQKLMQYELIMLTPTSDSKFVFNILLFIVIILFEQIILDQQLVFIAASFVCLISSAFYQYFNIFRRITMQLQSEHNIDKVISKIFVNETFKQQSLFDESNSDECLDMQMVYVSFLFKSHDDYEKKITKYSQIFNIIELLSKLFNGRLSRQNVDEGEATFDDFGNTDLKHFMSFANTLEELSDEFGLEICVIMSKNQAHLNEKLLFEVDPGVYVINITQFEIGAALHENESLCEIQHIMQHLQQKSNLQATELSQQIARIIELLPPQFQITNSQQYEFENEAITITALQPHNAIYNITQIMILKFTILSLDQLEEQENVQDYELVCNEINQQLAELFSNIDFELEQALVFSKFDCAEKKDKLAEQDSNSSVSSRSELLTARHVPTKTQMTANSYMSKGEDYIYCQLKMKKLENHSLFSLLKSIRLMNEFFLDYSSYLEDSFAQHPLMKPALIKARCQFRTFFYIPMYALFYIPEYYYFSRFFKDANIEFYNQRVSFLRFLFYQSVELFICSVLELFVCYPIYSYSEKVATNKTKSYNDPYIHLFNTQNKSSFAYNKVSRGRKFLFYVYYSGFLIVEYEFQQSVLSLKVGKQDLNYSNYIMFTTLPLFSNIAFEIFTSTISATPEELLSSQSFVFVMMKLITGIIGLTNGNYETILEALVIVNIYVYQLFELRNFIQYGKLQENNYRVLKEANERYRGKFDSFTLLVYNIIASKYVVLNTIIESNYIIRKAVIVNEIVEDFSLKLTFYEKISKYFLIMKDASSRQCCLIQYSDIVIVQFSHNEYWNFDEKMDYNDYIGEIPELYELPLKCPNCCYFVESDEPQHLHNAFQVIFAFAEGAIKKFKFKAAAITSGPIRIYFLSNGRIHIHSEALIDGQNIMPESGIIASGKLFQEYSLADKEYKQEITRRFKQYKSMGESMELEEQLFPMLVQYVNNGDSAIIAMKQKEQ